MSIEDATECKICYNEYDTQSCRPCVGTCGHSICESCKHQLDSTKCPFCNREEAFAKTTINDELLHLVTQIKSFGKSAGTPQISRSGEGVCSECTLRSRKLRVCITCALKSGLMKDDVENRQFVFNIEDKTIEQAFQEAKKKAICGDCVLDGPRHEGHKFVLLAVLARVLENDLETKKLDDQASKIKKDMEALRKRKNDLLEKLAENFDANFSCAQQLGETLDSLKDSVKAVEFPEKNKCASLNPILVADRKRAVSEPPLIGLFNPVDNSWKPVGRMLNLKSNFAVASENSTMFIVSGWINGTSIQSIKMYVGGIHVRRYCNLMRRPRTRTSACFHNNKLYVAGGFNNAYIKSVEIFDPRNGGWRDGPSLQYPRADASMVSCNGELFVLGGFNGIDYEERIEKLNEKTQQFEVFASMNGRAGFGACEFRGRIYIAGGWNISESAMRSVKSFDPETKTWRVEPSMNKERKFFTLHATNEAIYAIRGNTDNWVSIEEIEKFDPDQMKWNIVYR